MYRNYLGNVKDILRRKNSTCNHVDILYNKEAMINLAKDLINDDIRFKYRNDKIIITYNDIIIVFINDNCSLPIMMDHSTKEIIS